MDNGCFNYADGEQSTELFLLLLLLLLLEMHRVHVW